MLDKNLEELRKTQPALAKKIEETEITSQVTLFLGPNSDINIAYDGIALHNIADPMEEALNVFENGMVEDLRNEYGVIFIFGMGLGYLLRRTFISTKGSIIIYEPYMEVLRQTLEIVDLTKELSSKRVKIVTSPEQLISSLGRSYMIGDSFTALALPAYREKEPELFLAALDEIKSGMFFNVLGQNTALYMTEDFTRSSIKNIPLFLKYPDAAVLHDKCKGYPGVVVSAGPSFDRPGVVETLKEFRDNLVIASVGQAAKALDNVGIVPDFVCVVEVKDVSTQLTGVSYIEDTNLILLPQSNQKMFHFPTERKFICHTVNDPMKDWLSNVLKRYFFGYNHQGTVSITALIHLMKMGCNPIFLLGQDLAYPEGKLYANNSVYKGCRIIEDENGNRKVEWENMAEFYGLEGFQKDEADFQSKQKKFFSMLTEIKGWNGEKLFTQVSYEAYRKAFEYFQFYNPEYTLVNCSEGGAYINGYEHLPFREALEKYDVKQFDPKPHLKKVLEESYYEEEPESKIFQKVYERYKNDRENLNYMKLLAEEGLNEVKKALEHIENKKTISHSLKSRLKKMVHFDETLSEMTRDNSLINCYIKQEMFKFTKAYGRKLRDKDEEVIEGDIDALKENLENTKLLYEAVRDGAEKLVETLDTSFENFPTQSSDIASEREALNPDFHPAI